MKINDLKQAIINKQNINQFMIFVCKDNYFLANQYVDTICENNLLQKRFVDTLEETKCSALELVLDTSKDLNIIITDEFNEIVDSYTNYNNCIVICNKVGKEIQDKVNKFCIEFPSLSDWQIKEYIKNNCQGLDDYDANWLYTTTNDIYKIKSEIEKIKLFSIVEQKQILNDLRFDKATDLYNIDIYSLVNAIITKNILVINDYLLHKAACAVDPFLLINKLLIEFKKILFINFNSGLKQEQLGLTTKQYNAIKYYYKDFSKEYIEKAIGFLVRLDERIKTGKLDLLKESLIDYIICNVVSFNKK